MFKGPEAETIEKPSSRQELLSQAYVNEAAAVVVGGICLCRTDWACRMKWLGIAFALIVANVTLYGVCYRTPIASAQVQTYSKDQGYFYRFRAGFEVKATGELLDFDYIVACNVRLTRWRDEGVDNSTYSPRAMVKPTNSGQAVMLRTLDACHGLTSEHVDVPPDVLPLAIWFDVLPIYQRGSATLAKPRTIIL